MSAAVVVTGIGTLHAWGRGVAPLLQALREGVPRSSAVPADPGFPRRRATTAARVPDVDLADLVPPLAARRMSPPSRFAVAATRLALADAGIEAAGRPDPDLAVALATAYGPTSFTERLLDQIREEGPEAVSPALFTECVANAAASQIGIATRAAGPAHTVCAREAGEPMALARAAREIERGRARRALAGAVEEITPLLHGALDRLLALARPAHAGDDEIPRPFDRRRNGLLAAEGATVLVLEREDDAAARGAAPRARLAAWGAAFDPTAPRHGWGRGAGSIAEAIRSCLERSGLAPRDLDRVVSGASGARGGDRFEAEVLRALWHDGGLPPVLAPRGVVGTYGGAFLAAAVLALADEPWVAPVGFREPDPALGVAPHAGSTLPPPRRALVTAHASGGASAWLVLERS